MPGSCDDRGDQGLSLEPLVDPIGRLLTSYGAGGRHGHCVVRQKRGLGKLVEQADGGEKEYLLSNASFLVRSSGHVAKQEESVLLMSHLLGEAKTSQRKYGLYEARKNGGAYMRR